ncbi:DUF4179 domain-containing protein [Paenibacillus antarcticus]|uniref:Anti-sigma factor n=1 Tax=Paenibacillus antarcticus TaxID=253703 RepID=A0A162MID7_9BACL|nr:DUF4179 domain-containing protein [Paenibacillus antarcticus]OAB46773.1 anti-sigma factor [Paenibacillus antarcticus]
MKDIYELLNDTNIDDTEFEEIEANELEKANLKRTLKQSISKKKSLKRWKKDIAAASIIIILSFTTFGIAFPTYASNLPVIGDIFRYLSKEDPGSSLYDNYQEYSSQINMTEESNGIKITIKDAIYDGNTVSLTYSIESERDLGYNSMIRSPSIIGSNGSSGSSKISRVDANHYVGIDHTTGYDMKEQEQVKINWDINSILIQETLEEVKGNWNFNFTLKATESKEQLINHSTEQNGVKVTIVNMSITPMSFVIHYDQEVSEMVRTKWHAVDVYLDIKDDLGNSYSGKGNGGTGTDDYNMSWSKTFQKLDSQSTKLIVTPLITLRSYTSENHGSVLMSRDGESKKIPIPKKSGKGQEGFALPDIIIDLKK